MKKYLLLLFPGLLVFFLTHAQSREKDVESSVESLNNAMIAKNKPVLEKLVSNDVSYGHSTGAVQNKEEFMQDIMIGVVRFASIGSENQKITFTDDLAIVRNISSIKGNRGDAPLDLKIGILMVWKKEKDQWQLVARQGYKLQ
jgi:ketosteroid isomerase-like protein